MHGAAEKLKGGSGGGRSRALAVVSGGRAAKRAAWKRDALSRPPPRSVTLAIPAVPRHTRSAVQPAVQPVVHCASTFGRALITHVRGAGQLPPLLQGRDRFGRAAAAPAEP
eukprot:365581-Chlamydomonas_euryale.AAC.2